MAKSAEQTQAEVMAAHLARQAEGYAPSVGNSTHTFISARVKAIDQLLGQDIGDRNLHILDTLRVGEPICIFRAKDLLSVMVLIEYLNFVEKYGVDLELQEAITEKIAEFKNWQKANPSLVKLPD